MKTQWTKVYNNNANKRIKVQPKEGKSSVSDNRFYRSKFLVKDLESNYHLKVSNDSFK